MRRPQPLSAAAPAVQLGSPGLLGWVRPDRGCLTLSRSRESPRHAGLREGRWCHRPRVPRA
eukprot:scaffold129041_cov57-Phaeocystis_antarctica.AAC.4